MAASTAAVGAQRTPRGTLAPRSTVRWNCQRPKLRRCTTMAVGDEEDRDGLMGSAAGSSQMERPPPVNSTVGDRLQRLLISSLTPSPSRDLEPISILTLLQQYALAELGAVLRRMAACTCFNGLPADSPLAAAMEAPPSNLFIHGRRRLGRWCALVLLFCSVVVHADAGVPFSTWRSWVVMVNRFASHSLYLHVHIWSYFLIVSSLFNPSISLGYSTPIV